MKGPWPIVRLGEILTHRKDFIVIDDLQTYKRARVQLHAQGIVLRDEVPGAMIKTKKQQLCRAGEFLVAEIDAKVGGCGLVPPQLEGAIVSSHYFLFVAKDDRLDRGFLGWFIKTRAFRQQVEAQGSTNYAAIRPADVLSYEMPLPPLDEQRRIVARIEEVAAKIAEARLLREQTLGEVVALHSSAVSSALDSMQSEMKTVDEIVGRDALRNGKSVKPTGEDGAIRCLTLKSMRRGRIDLTQSKPVPLTAEDARQFTVRRRDVFIVRGNGSKHLCGQAGLVQDETENVVFPDLFIRVPLPTTLLLPEFFVAIWNSGPVRAEIEDKAKTTSGIWKINQTHIASTRIPVPSLAEQHHLVTYLDGLDRKADALKRLQGETAAELDAMLPAILDLAFKGDL